MTSFATRTRTEPPAMKILPRTTILACGTLLLFSGCRLPHPSQPLLPAGTHEERAPGVPTAAREGVATPLSGAPSELPSLATLPLTPVPATERIVKLRLTYTVSGGELLWSIAKRPDIYGDPSLWPLLYQANRDQIKDPAKIYAGQILSIPRNCSEEERAEARAWAKKFDIFSSE